MGAALVDREVNKEFSAKVILEQRPRGTEEAEGAMEQFAEQHGRRDW